MSAPARQLNPNPTEAELAELKTVKAAQATLATFYAMKEELRFVRSGLRPEINRQARRQNARLGRKAARRVERYLSFKAAAAAEREAREMAEREHQLEAGRIAREAREGLRTMEIDALLTRAWDPLKAPEVQAAPKEASAEVHVETDFARGMASGWR